MLGSELRWVPEFGLLQRAIIRVYGSLSAPTVTRYMRFKYFALTSTSDTSVRDTTRAGLVGLVERAGFEIVAEPAYSPPGPNRALGLLGAAYTSLMRSPDHPLLDFGSLPRLRLWKKAGLAVLWPFYRLALELDAAFADMRNDRIALIARSRGGPRLKAPIGAAARSGCRASATSSRLDISSWPRRPRRRPR